MSVRIEPRRHREAGFTLIELMVTLTIAAILLAIAVPSYTTQMRKSRRTDARSALLDLATREERYLSLNNAYTNSAKFLAYSTTDTPLTNQSVGSGYYQISVTSVVAATAAAPATFTVTATPIAGTSQAKDSQCASFTVTSTGKQSALDSGGNDASAACWN